MALITLLLVLSAGAVWADGILIPEPGVPPLAIQYHRVSVHLDDQVAHTEIDQAFLNSTPRGIEGTYVFPLPRGASFSAFSMFVDGEPLSAEVLEADEARRLYEEIVRRRIDPALLEYAGQGAYRARIFPIPARGSKRVQLAYDELLREDGGVIRYRYPLGTEKFSTEPLEDVSVTVEIHSAVPIKAIYSPSHPIIVERDGEYVARIIYADEEVTPSQDFLLYYTVERDEVGVDLLTYMPPDETRAYYLLLAAPQFAPVVEQVIPKRLILVMDRSGSMAGEKMNQARAALRFAVNSLRDGDAVNIIDYGTGVSAFADSAVIMGAETRTALLRYVEGLEATGGTYIEGALRRSLEMLRGDARAEMIVFFTDGKPTVGERDLESLLTVVAAARIMGARLFTFGVGYEVNTHLLDRLADTNGGTSTYVEPGEDIELAVSAFYAKVSNPVMEDLRLEIHDARRSDYYPPELPDLFRGGQVVQVGRLEADGSVNVELSGQVRGTAVRYATQADPTSTGADFLPRLWATRKVGFLLDQIRLHGEDAELVDAVIALSRRYGIITPYTSFLITEDAPPAAVPLLDKEFAADSGVGAVAASEAMRAYAGADNTAAVRSGEVRYVGGKTFFQRDGVWQDSQWRLSASVREYGFASSAYFDLVARHPELGAYLSLGAEVDFMQGDEAFRIRTSSTQIEEGQATVLPERVVLAQNFPNPFNSDTVIRFSLPGTGRVELSVYALSGQCVARLAGGELAAGKHQVRWDGRAIDGSAVASGVFLYKLCVGTQTLTRKLLLLR